MRALIKLTLLTIAGIGMISTSLAETAEGWSADLEKSIEKAKAEDKAVLVQFTGSDWCPACIQMRKLVFSKKEFIEEASKNYVLVEIDIPKKDPDLKKKNEPLLMEYDINSWPTLVLLDSDGDEFKRFSGTKHPTVEGLIGYLNKALDWQGLD